jgi:CRP/FNR family nitrogen fixation transcriptional regulator
LSHFCAIAHAQRFDRRRIPLLTTINETILAAARLKTINLQYGVDDTVYAQGAPSQFVYIIDEGALLRFKLLPGWRKSILQFLFPGDGFGFEISRYHLDAVQALTPVRVRAARRGALIAAATSNAGLSKLLFNSASRALATAEEQSTLLRGRHATERLALFLLDLDARLHGQIDLPMRRKHIANHLGLTEETISRKFSALQRLKIIRFVDDRQRRMVIRDKPRLQQLASDASDFDYSNTLKRRKT